MKQQPALHPRDLLKDMQTRAPSGPQIRAKVGFSLITGTPEQPDVSMIVAEGGVALQLELMSEDRIAEFSSGLKRMLNVWDIGAPYWLWQLDALIDTNLRRLVLAEKEHGKIA